MKVIILALLLSSCVQDLGSETKFITRSHRDNISESYRKLYTEDIYKDSWTIAYGYASCSTSELAQKRQRQREILAAIERVIKLWLQPVYDLYRQFPDTPLVRKINFVERPAVPQVPAYFEHHHGLSVSYNNYQMQVILYCEKDNSYAAIGKQEFHLFEANYRPIPEEVADTGYDAFIIAHELGHLFGIAHTYIRDNQLSTNYQNDSGTLGKVVGTHPASIMALFYLAGNNGTIKLTRDDYLAIQWAHDFYHDGKHKYYRKENLVSDPKQCYYDDYKYEEVRDKNGKVTVRGCVPKYPLIFELKQGHLRIAQQIISEDPNVDLNLQEPTSGLTAMHYAVILDGVNLVSSLLLNGAKVAITTKKDRATPLHYAAMFGRLRIVDLLLTHPAIEINAKNISGNTALHLAVQQGNSKVVRSLIAQPKIDVNQTNNDGNSPLHLAVNLGKEEIVGTLIDGTGEIALNALSSPAINSSSRLQINLPAKDGTTILHSAVRNGYTAIVRLLIAEEEMQVNAVDRLGRTALHQATIEGHVDSVRELLTRDDLDTSIRDNQGNTALSLARRARHSRIIRLLEDN